MTGTLTEQEKLWALYIQLLVSRGFAAMIFSSICRSEA